MGRFFISGTPNGTAILSGEDGHHIARSLRMQVGEPLTLCNGAGLDFETVITGIDGDNVTVSIQAQHPSTGESDCKITVYQGLPKSDKMDWIAQKTVETGAVALVPMMTERCVSRPDEKSAVKKRERWQKIAVEAAKQCGRGILPPVAPVTDFYHAIEEAAAKGPILFFYEGGGVPLSQFHLEQKGSYSVFIGPEGGFAEEEVAFAKAHGAAIASLGPRILRTETAAIVAVSAMLACSGNL